MSNESLITVIISLCCISLFSIIIWEIYTDIKYTLYKKQLNKKTNNKCPHCNKKLKIQSVSKNNYGDIDYFIYCNECNTMYKIKYKE